MSYHKHPEYVTMDEAEIERRYPFGMQRFLNPNPPPVDNRKIINRKIIEFRGLPREAKGRSFWDYGLPPISGTSSEVIGDNIPGSGHPFHRDRFRGPIPLRSKVVAIKLIPRKISDIAKLIEEAEVGNPNRVVTSGVAHPELDYLERKYGGRHIQYPTRNGYAMHSDRSRGPPPPDMKLVSYEILHPNAPKEFDPCVEDEEEDEEVLVKNHNPAADSSSLTTGAASGAKAEVKGRSVFDDDLSLSSEEAVLKNPDPAADSSAVASGAAVSASASGNN